MANPNPVITLGGKGSTLTSSSLYSISHNLSQVRIDSSAIEKLSSSTSPPSIKYKFSFPNYFTPEEIRASLTLLLNKLLLSGSSSKSLPVKLSELLNNYNGKLDNEIDVTKEEFNLLDNLCAELYGVCGILSYKVMCLSSGICDMVAALSCEALKADVSGFNAIDSGDGFSVKDEIGAASDLKVLLNGSKFVGKVVGCELVSEIPRIHGSLREVAKTVHLRARVELNSGVRVGKLGIAKVIAPLVSNLANAVINLGESSLGRMNLNLDSIKNNEKLRMVFDEKCLSLDSLGNSFKLILEANIDKDYVKFLHEVNALMGMVWDIVTWEAITAFVSLEGESIGKGQTVEVNGGNEKVDKKSEKKKKKAVLGKGTSVIVQLIKDRFQTVNVDTIDRKLVEAFYAFLDPRDSEFTDLLKTIKDIVESNESRRLPKLPKGTRDFSREQMAIREKAFSIITDVFKRHGATSLDTPVFELRETLMGKYGEDSKLVYDLADQGGELCSLRYDLTVPFARFVAMNGLTSFKRYQIAKVYRRDNPSKGRYREFYQCDLDIAGQYETMGPDFEIVKILTELLDELEIGDYEVKLNHRKLLDGMFEICGVPPEKFRTICSSVDKLDKQSFDQIKKEMVEEKGLSVETADKIGSFVKERGSPLELLSKLKQEGSGFLKHNGSAAALNELEILFKALESSKCISKVVFDLSLARGLDYYTGLIFEAVFKGTTQVGSIAAGGRYDNLIGMFGAKQVPAVGVSLGIERVFALLEDRNQQAIRATETQVLVSILGDDISKAAELVSELWNAKIKAEFMVNKRSDKHFNRVRDSKIPWMVLVGEREFKDGVVRIKDIEANKEHDSVPRSRFVEELQILMKAAINNTQ